MDGRQMVVREEVIGDGSEEVYETVVDAQGNEIILEEIPMDESEGTLYEVHDQSGRRYVQQAMTSHISPSGARFVTHRSQPGPAMRTTMIEGQPSARYTPIRTVQVQPVEQQYQYAIRGTQVFRIDKASGIATPVRSLPVVQSVNKEPIYASQHREQRSFRPQLYRPLPSSTTPYSRSMASGIMTNTYASESRSPINRILTPCLAVKMAQKKQSGGVGNRKPCNCSKSMCLKLYCDCFANGEFCNDCNCKDCHNNLENEAERSRAIKASLERNPHAFKPKIGVAARGLVDVERLHQKGCHCKKSNCLKNYCECYEAKVACTDRCKCTSCRNTESDRAIKYRDSKYANSSAIAHLTPPSIDFRPSSPLSDDDEEHDPPETCDPKTLPWYYLTDEVIEATTLCLVAQIDAVESSAGEVSELTMQKALIREFGQCLESIIANATQSSDNATTAKVK
ncbi:hypothetical protein AB6A40_006684 [Gnathostoma spinigerum]|uniref:CRC domain-containing protein n=1 Tax=Gnathostoma spinigerum TaxID=75299 RepID=A0ABD6EK95_9BILA